MNPQKQTAFSPLGCRPIINASGKMTALGASTVSDGVADALRTASQDFVDIDELMVASGRVIAEHTGAEDGCPSTGAAAAIVLSVAAAVTGGRLSLTEAVPDLPEGTPREIVIQKGHAVHFGSAITQLIRLGGGIPVEVGHVNTVRREHVEEMVGPQTAAVLFIKSHHAVQKGMQPLDVLREVAHAHDLPLLVDAAAGEDLRTYVDRGADLVMYSGAKALSGPTSGFLCGKRDLVAAARAQYQGVGRPMKVGKEAILGLCRALQEYGSGADAAGQMHSDMQHFAARLDQLSGLTCAVTQDEAGRAIYRTSITVDPERAGLSAAELARRLRDGDPSIHTRDHWANTGTIAIDPRPLQDGDLSVIETRIRDILTREVSSHA